MSVSLNIHSRMHDNSKRNETHGGEIFEGEDGETRSVWSQSQFISSDRVNGLNIFFLTYFYFFFFSLFLFPLHTFLPITHFSQTHRRPIYSFRDLLQLRGLKNLRIIFGSSSMSGFKKETSRIRGCHFCSRLGQILVGSLERLRLVWNGSNPT